MSHVAGHQEKEVVTGAAPMTTKIRMARRTTTAEVKRRAGQIMTPSRGLQSRAEGPLTTIKVTRVGVAWVPRPRSSFLGVDQELAIAVIRVKTEARMETSAILRMSVMSLLMQNLRTQLRPILRVGSETRAEEAGRPTETPLATQIVEAKRQVRAS